LKRQRNDRSPTLRILTNSDGLTDRQRRAIPIILAARTIEEGCLSAKITTQTWYSWLKAPVFKAEVDRQRDVVIAETLDRLKAAICKAVERLALLMDSTSESIQLRACGQVIDYFLKAREIESIERRLTELERLADLKKQRR